jgi:hypothetical protein
MSLAIAQKIQKRNEFIYFAKLSVFVKYLIMKFFLVILFLHTTVLVKSQNTSSTSLHFTPTSFSNSFTLNREPVLKIRSGDTVSTETIDAGGFDKKGVRRQKTGQSVNRTILY